MKFLLDYANRHKARQKGWPLAGSLLEVGSLEELTGLSEGFGYSIIIKRPKTHCVWWPEYLSTMTKDEIQEEHVVQEIPEDWIDYRWVEVYNGRRE